MKGYHCTNITRTALKDKKYVDFLWRDVNRNALAELRVEVSQINVHRRRFSPAPHTLASPVGP